MTDLITTPAPHMVISGDVGAISEIKNMFPVQEGELTIDSGDNHQPFLDSLVAMLSLASGENEDRVTSSAGGMDMPPASEAEKPDRTELLFSHVSMLPEQDLRTSIDLPQQATMQMREDQASEVEATGIVQGIAQGISLSGLPDKPPLINLTGKELPDKPPLINLTGKELPDKPLLAFNSSGLNEPLTFVSQQAEPEILDIDIFLPTQKQLTHSGQTSELAGDRQMLQNTLVPGNPPPADPLLVPLTRISSLQSTVATEVISTSPSQVLLTDEFGQANWDKGMGKQILWLVNQNIRSAELRLNPAHLGPLEVRININDEQVNVAFSSQHAVVRDAVQLALPQLREIFEDNELNLADTDISQHLFSEQSRQESSSGLEHQTDTNVAQTKVSHIEENALAEILDTVNMALVDYYI